MIRQTSLAQTIDLAADKARYDACAKKILSFRAIIAWILKCCTKEFSQYTVPYIYDNCLPEAAEISTHAVHQDEKNGSEILDGNQRIDGQNTEANSIKEQTVYYDVRFGAILPEGNEPIRIIINLEIQLDDHPGYPIVKRGFYYCGRMISEQYGTVFTKEQYDKLEKVYSIWICPDPAKKRKNGIFRYHTVEETIIGTSCTQSDDYDMMEVIILNLGDTSKDGAPEILNLLNVLFSPTISPEEKKQKLQKEYHIAMTDELESEVRTMCNLSEGLVEMGIEYGKEQGIKQGIEQKNLILVQMMLEDHEPMDKIRKYTGYTIDELKEIEKMIRK